MRRSTLLHFAPFCSLLLMLTVGAAAQTTTVLRPGAYGAKSWREPVATAASLPTTGNLQGDARVAKDTGVAWVWTGSTWVSGTVGPQGPQGIQGPPGPQGATGSQGATGPQGPQGNPGAAGSPGAPGATWLSGTSAPTSGQGADGDFYYRTATGDVYGKAAGSWSILANLTGPAGAAGPAGADGATGPQGPAGAAGAAGADGKTVRNGSGDPSSGLGVDGDFYIDTTATEIYGPKAAGAWGSGTSLIGPQGPVGATGATGPAGPVAGSDTQIIFNDAGAAAGGVGLTWNKTTTTLATPTLTTGNIKATANTISSTDTNGNINIRPNGSGNILGNRPIVLSVGGQCFIAGTAVDNYLIGITDGAGGQLRMQLGASLRYTNTVNANDSGAMGLSYTGTFISFDSTTVGNGLGAEQAGTRRLVPRSTPPFTCDSSKEGSQYYDLEDHDLCTCKGASPAWASSGAGACT